VRRIERPIVGRLRGTPAKTIRDIRVTCRAVASAKADPRPATL